MRTVSQSSSIESLKKMSVSDILDLLTSRPDVLDIMETSLNNFYKVQNHLNRRMKVLDALMQRDDCTYTNLLRYRKDHDECMRRHRSNSSRMLQILIEKMERPIERRAQKQTNV